MGVFKTESQAPAQPKPHVEPKSIVGEIEKPVSPELYKYFNLNPVETNDHFKTVSRWATDSSKTTGEALRLIRNLELKLGQPQIGETRLSKLYNYVRAKQSVNNAKVSFKE